VPARLGFAASNHAFFIANGVAVPAFPVGYITFQRGASNFVVRQTVAVACTTPDHCVGTTGLVGGVPGFVAVPGPATLTLSGTISSAQGTAYPVGAAVTVTLTISASATGVVTASAVTVAVNGTSVASWTAPFPFGTSIQLSAAAPLIL
jgi:hypothetical protein